MSRDYEVSKEQHHGQICQGEHTEHIHTNDQKCSKYYQECKEI